MTNFIKKVKVQWILIVFISIVCVALCACGSQTKQVDGKFPNTAAENATIAEKYKDIANEMAEFSIKEFTENISKIYRESLHTEEINKYIYNWGISHNVKTTMDQSGCVYYDVPATTGCENYPTIILQAHTDMVCTSIENSIDMSKTPLDIVFDEEDSSLHSRDFKTNIGADDAEGMTALMVLATNQNYKHGPLRMLFTYDEENSMRGAKTISPEVLSPKYLVNVDAGPVGSSCISSAGIIKTEFKKQYETTKSTNNTKIDISIKDLLGGHSGEAIAKERLCANVVMGQVLQKVLDQGINMQIANVKGGTASNVIASTANFSIFVDKNDVEKVKQIISDEFNNQKSIKTEDKDAKIEISEAEATATSVLTTDESKAFVEFINKLPHGCREKDSQNGDKPLVSSNLGTITLENGTLDIVIHSRSNIDGRNEDLDKQMAETCKEFGVTYIVLGQYKAWEKNKDTSLNELWNKAYLDACQIKNLEYTTHGGLECSRFLEKNPNLIMLSVGMDVADEHAVTERLYTKSIPAFYAGFINFLENANQL